MTDDEKLAAINQLCEKTIDLTNDAIAEVPEFKEYDFHLINVGISRHYLKKIIYAKAKHCLTLKGHDRYFQLKAFIDGLMNATVDELISQIPEHNPAKEEAADILKALLVPNAWSVGE